MTLGDRWSFEWGRLKKGFKKRRDAQADHAFLPFPSFPCVSSQKVWRSGRPRVPFVSFLSVCLQPHVSDGAEPIRACVDLKATPGDRASFLFLALWFQPLMSAMGFEPMCTCVQWILSSPPKPLGQTGCCRQVAIADHTGIPGDTGRSVKFWVWGRLKKGFKKRRDAQADHAFLPFPSFPCVSSQKVWRSGRPRVPFVSFLSVCPATRQGWGWAHPHLRGS